MPTLIMMESSGPPVRLSLTGRTAPCRSDPKEILMLAITVTPDHPSVTSITSNMIDGHQDVSNLKRRIARRLRAFPSFIDSPELRNEHDQALLRSDLAIGAAHFRF